MPQKNQEGNVVVKRRHARITSSKTWVLAGNILGLNQHRKRLTALKTNNQTNKQPSLKKMWEEGEGTEGNKIPDFLLRDLVL